MEHYRFVSSRILQWMDQITIWLNCLQDTFFVADQINVRSLKNKNLTMRHPKSDPHPRLARASRIIPVRILRGRGEAGIRNSGDYFHAYVEFWALRALNPRPLV